MGNLDNMDSDWMLMVPEHSMLRGQRGKLGLSQEEVANKAGIKLEQYQKFESGERDISSSTFRIVNAVLTALELDISAFDKGEYSFEPVPEDDPIYKYRNKI